MTSRQSGSKFLTPVVLHKFFHADMAQMFIAVAAAAVPECWTFSACCRDSWGKDHYGHQTVPRLIAEKEWEALTLQLYGDSAQLLTQRYWRDEKALPTCWHRPERRLAGWKAERGGPLGPDQRCCYHRAGVFWQGCNVLLTRTVRENSCLFQGNIRLYTTGKVQGRKRLGIGSAMEVKDILSLDDEVLSKIHQFYFIQLKLSCASHLPTGHSPAVTWANGRQMASPSVALHTGNLLQWCRIVIYQNKTKSRGIFSWQIYFFKRTWSWGMKKPLTLPHFSRILNANRKPTSLLKGICCACFSKDEKYLYTGLLDQSITAWDVASDGFIVITKLSYRIREKFHCPKTTPPRYNPLQNIEALCMVKSRNTDRENSSKQQHNQADSSRSLTYTSKPSSICSVV
ncbi:unnamed protein product [Bubo scandiacus]